MRGQHARLGAERIADALEVGRLDEAKEVRRELAGAAGERRRQHAARVAHEPLDLLGGGTTAFSEQFGGQRGIGLDDGFLGRHQCPLPAGVPGPRRYWRVAAAASSASERRSSRPVSWPMASAPSSTVHRSSMAIAIS